MRFNIITPTYKRPEGLSKAIDSMINQTYSDWRMFIIGDSPDDSSYKSVEEKIQKEKRITYVMNEKNMGANFSRNLALDLIKKDTSNNDWVILLDDDDILAKDTLETFSGKIIEYPKKGWFLSNRASYEGESMTKIPKSEKNYSYIWSFLITKKLKGDATHCIRVADIKNVYFPKNVKQGEEWLFFYELSLKEKFLYINHNSTLSKGYSADGLNFRIRTKKDRLNDLILLIKESWSRKIIWHPTILLYFLARFILIPFK